MLPAACGATRSVVRREGLATAEAALGQRRDGQRRAGEGRRAADDLDRRLVRSGQRAQEGDRGRRVLLDGPALHDDISPHATDGGQGVQGQLDLGGRAPELRSPVLTPLNCRR